MARTDAKKGPKPKKGKEHTPSYGKGPDALMAGLRPSERKLLKDFVKKVEDNLWGVDNGDRERALRDLKEHILEKADRWHEENAIEIAIFSLGSPEVIAKGLRTLYGYSTGFKAILLSLVALISIPTVIMLNPLMNVLSIMSLVVLFYLLSHFGTRTGLAFGAGMGLTAAMTRSLAVMIAVAAFPEDLAMGTRQAVMDSILIDIFLLVVGLLAGHVRDSAVRDYFTQQAA
jgi:hypothetical protein